MSCANASGNDAYKAGDLQQAVKYYSDAISSPEAAEPAELAKYLSNRCHVYNQLKKYDLAVADASFALKLQPKHAKALVRRGLAHANLENHAAALNDMQLALSLCDPPLPASLRNVAIRTLGEVKAAIAAEAAAEPEQPFSQALAEGQTYRLHFRAPPPSQVPLGAWFRLGVNVANEFGLFRRADFPSATAIPLVVKTEPAVLTVETRPVEDSEVSILGMPTSARVFFECRLLPNEDGSSEAALEGSAWRLCLQVALEPHHGILDVLTPTLMVPREGGVLQEALEDPLGIVAGRALPIRGLSSPVLVAESPGQLGIGGKVWDAGLVLTEYLIQVPSMIAAPKRCIELGSGTGLVGVGAASIGADIIITDIAEDPRSNPNRNP